MKSITKEEIKNLVKDYFITIYGSKPVPFLKMTEEEQAVIYAMRDLTSNENYRSQSVEVFRNFFTLSLFKVE
ncbi:hypothetical protein [Lactococcus protaetiae]|uniref:Uncharacterized protein n=1 Tax=Lactococcus protaetiae TaxID=2592653 RepID=A0A514Z835_9LACT|nr:hypothetical protein [Lactococcus protaetiae]QDK70752.1 hypothetical protein FLP15_05770 [Lactococcus protaetiae]